MDKYIGFDIDSKKTVACVVQKGEKDRYTTFKTDVVFLSCRNSSNQSHQPTRSAPGRAQMPPKRPHFHASAPTTTIYRLRSLLRLVFRIQIAYNRNLCNRLGLEKPGNEYQVRQEAKKCVA